MTDEIRIQLIKQALEACTHSYSPYSNFKVGAALLCDDGQVFCGANLENATYTPTNCAERTALFTAVFNGKRNFKAIAVVGGPNGKCKELCPPCGVCRQALREFCKDDFEIILSDDNLNFKVFTLKQMLPYSFDKSNLN